MIMMMKKKKKKMMIKISMTVMVERIWLLYGNNIIISLYIHITLD